MPYRVRDYKVDDIRDAERLAAMFNDFDSAWPGGFNRGVPDTAERLQENMSRKRRVAILVAECDDEFVGFCDLEAQSGQTDAAYVPLLGARLAHHGKGVGKMLLREIVRRATERGYKQVTLYTWPGNTKAVPLYKKTGFNWVPETDVFMRNYLPSALTIPAGKIFFTERDWYECLEREIQVAPDDVKWNGMQVYPYRFRAGDDFLNLTFDANAHGLTAIETPAYSLSCCVPVEEAPAGETFPITWEIASRDGKPLDVVLLTETDPGLELSVQERFVVEGEAALTRDLRVSADAVPRRWGETAHRVRSTLLIDGQPVVLETGVKVVRPVEIFYGGQALFAGREETITVILQSKLERPLTGRLALEAHPSLDCDQPACDFTLEPRMRTQCRFRVRAKESGVFTTQLKFTAGETQGARPVMFRAFGNGVNALASIDTVYDETAVLESSGLSVNIGLRGGHMRLHLPTRKRGVMGQELAELGPPYVEEPMTHPLYTARADQTPDGTALTLTAPSQEFPGLTVERSVTIVSGDLARVDSRVYNTTDQTLPAKLRLETNPWLHHYLTAPTPQGLIREPGWGDSPWGDVDLLAHGSAYTESWAAMEEDGFVCGLLWEGEPKQEMSWSPLPKLTYDLGELPPYSVRSIPPVYLVAGTGDWETVRAWWRRLIKPVETGEEPRPEPLRVLEVRAEPSPALLQSNQADVSLAVLNRRGKALTGTLTLSGETFRAEPAEFALEAVDRDRPFTTAVHVMSPEAPTAGFLKATLHDGANVTELSVPLIRIAAGETLSVTPAEDNTFVVENGLFSLRVAPEFLGSLIALEKDGVNHLLSGYPQSRPFVWANPWFGGIHPFLGGFMGDVRLTRETFTGEPVERIGERGLRWRGVRVACAPKHKDLRWLRLEVEYLTLPGSNVLALVSRWTNGNTARTETGGGMAVWPQLGGTRENTIAYWDFKGERHERRRGGFGIQALSKPSLALENPATGDVLFLIASDPRAHTGFFDFREEGVHLFASGPMHFEPNETKERLSWLVLSRDKTQQEAYASLAKVRNLP